MTPVRYGVVSTAKIGRDWVIPAIQATTEAEVVAISSRDALHGRRVADEFGIKASYGSLEELLADGNVEAVYIPTPNSSHVEDAIAAARAGKHVLCEKPLGLNAEEAVRLRAVQAETGVQITEAFMVRYHPRWLAARDIVRSGRLGQITQIHATYSVMNDNPDDIRFKPELGGGALCDVGVYPITAARFLFECEPFAVTARAQMDRPGGVDIAVSGMLEFPCNRTLLFSGALRQAWAHWIMVTGTEGWMEIPIAVWPSASIETRIRIRGKADLDDSNIEEIRIPPANQYEHEIVTFSRVVRGLLPQPWPIDNAVAGMRILDAIRLSCARGERVIFEC
jgi:predicted dehydrogenase